MFGYKIFYMCYIKHQHSILQRISPANFINIIDIYAHIYLCIGHTVILQMVKCFDSKYNVSRYNINVKNHENLVFYIS